jgi:hypothetical protein
MAICEIKKFADHQIVVESACAMNSRVEEIPRYARLAGQ